VQEKASRKRRKARSSAGSSSDDAASGRISPPPLARRQPPALTGYAALLASKAERQGLADLEALVQRARPLKFGVHGELLEAGEGQPSRPCLGARTHEQCSRTAFGTNGLSPTITAPRLGSPPSAAASAAGRTGLTPAHLHQE
jgi:hypothetical protein